MKFKAQFLRVYFNRDIDPAKAWSVDTGLHTAELSCTQVVFEGASGGTIYDPSAGDHSGAKGQDVKSPRAWFTFHNVEVEEENGTLIIRPLLLKDVLKNRGE